jgi:hypothetical protein
MIIAFAIMFIVMLSTTFALGREFGSYDQKKKAIDNIVALGHEHIGIISQKSEDARVAVLDNDLDAFLNAQSELASDVNNATMNALDKIV